MFVEYAYEIAEASIDSHVVKMKSLNADVFVDITTAKFAAQAIRKAGEIGWKPLHFVNQCQHFHRQRHQSGRL